MGHQRGGVDKAWSSCLGLCPHRTLLEGQGSDGSERGTWARAETLREPAHPGAAAEEMVKQTKAQDFHTVLEGSLAS